MTKKIIIFSLLTSIVTTVLGGTEKADSSKIYFENAFVELKSMIEGKQSPDFERAVFISENAYWDNKYFFSDFQKGIDVHVSFIKGLVAANNKSDSIDFSIKVNAKGRFKISDIRYTERKKGTCIIKHLKTGLFLLI